jgi:hypothetical protein
MCLEDLAWSVSTRGPARWFHVGQTHQATGQCTSSDAARASRKSSVMRDKLASVLAVGTFIAVKASLDAVADYFGIRTYIAYESPRTIDYGGGAEDEVNGFTTDFGLYGFVLGAMLAWRVYYWKLEGKWSGGLTLRQLLLWRVWLAGTTGYTAISVAISLVPIELPAIVIYVGKLGLAAACYVAGRP